MKAAGGLVTAGRLTYQEHAVGLWSKAKKKAKKAASAATSVVKTAQKNVNRFTEATHVSALKDVGNLAGDGGLLKDPKAYAKGIKKGVGKDLGTAAGVMGRFASGKWTSLGQEFGGDMATAIGADSKTKQKWSGFGKEAGDNVEKAKAAKDAAEAAQSGDYAKAALEAEKVGGPVASLAREAKPAIDTYNAIDSALEVYEQGGSYAALEELAGADGMIGEYAGKAKGYADTAQGLYNQAQGMADVGFLNSLESAGKNALGKVANDAKRTLVSKVAGNVGSKAFSNLGADDLASMPGRASTQVQTQGKGLIASLLSIFGL